MITKLKNYLKVHFSALPDDLEQPFVKKADLVLKLFGIVFTILGIALILSSIGDYSREAKQFYAGYYQTINSRPITNADQLKLIYEIQRDRILTGIFYKLILGFSFIVFSFALFGAILMTEYISFTLPDKIYLRCFATKEEKEKKRKFT